MTKLDLTPGGIVALVGTIVSAVVGLLVAFHVVAFTSDQTTALVTLATFGTGSGLLIFGWLQTWATDTYDVGQVSAGLTTAASVVLGALSAFGLFHASAGQQVALTTVCGALALGGAYVFAALHTRKVVQARRLSGRLTSPYATAGVQAGRKHS